MAMKRVRKSKELRPEVSSHLDVGAAAISIADADVQNTLNHKRAKRQKQPIHRLRIPLLPRRVWVHLCHLYQRPA